LIRYGNNILKNGNVINNNMFDIYNILSTAYMRDKFYINSHSFNIPDYETYIIDLRDVFIRYHRSDIQKFIIPNFTRLCKFEFYGKLHLENIHHITDAICVSLTGIINTISLPKFTRLTEITLENISVDNIDHIIDAKYVTLKYVKNLVSLPKFTQLRHIHLEYLILNDVIMNSIINVESLVIVNCINVVNLDKLTNLSRIIILSMTDDIKTQIETLKKYNNDLLISYKWP
jgi:hypothetical protein